MTRARNLFAFTAVLLLTPWVLCGQPAPQSEWVVQSLRGEAGGVVYDFQTGIATATNGVLIKYGGAVLTAERAALNQASGEVVADGQVRIQQGDQLWASEHVRYNFKTRQMQAQQFRTGETPLFASGQDLQGDLTNRIYTAERAMITTDDVAQPGIKLRARRITIIPGKRIEATHATLYFGAVPVFYFPYYTRNIGEHPNNFNATPGYRSLFGPFILGSYTWYWSEELDGILHLDYRQKRGPGGGPDLNYHLGRWGEGSFKYYYTHDNDSNVDELGVPIPEDRQRIWFSYESNPATNLYLKSLVRWESDLAVVRDFFESEYRLDPQPSTFFEANKFWRDFSVDAYVQPRPNTWLQTVERLPDVRLTGYRQEIGSSPFYYESESSAGYYQFRFAEDGGIYGAPPGLDYMAGRADTFHQVLMPETFFGWFNVTPRVGGRLTCYTDAAGPGATTTEEYRGVFNTGAEVSFKAARLWPEFQSKTFDADGLRHIVEPSANYVYVPSPSEPPSRLPQFDYELPSLRLLPIEYPDYNAIDSVDSQNVIRWGLHNRLQTKRAGAVVNLVNWDLYTDWRLKPRSDQTTFSDLYSDITVRPRSWLAIESLARYDIDGNDLFMAFNTMTIQPSDLWSWRVGYYYQRDDIEPSPTALGPGNSVLTSSFGFRFNENWAFRMNHYFEVKTGTLQEQSYTLYRDLRSWTAALSFLTRNNTTGPQDYTVAFTFSLKAYPRYGLGRDIGGPSALLGM
jgi:LPS-assembly protein